MRRILWFLAIFIIMGLVQAGAFADSTCDGAPCTTFTGYVLDPHGQGIPDHLVYAKLGQTYQVTARTDSAGKFTLNVPTQGTNNCWIIGGATDEFYTQASGGNLCKDGSVNLHPFFRVRAWNTPREMYVPQIGTIPYHLEVYSNSKTNPARFENDPLTYTLTYHTVSPVRRFVYKEGVFGTPTAAQTSPGVWKYIWKIDLQPVVTEPTMVHVDWGRASTFGQMMDCRMLFVGVGQEQRTGMVFKTGSTITLDGTSFGDTQGVIVLEQSTKNTAVDPLYITEWTNTRIRFLLPPTITSDAWVRVWRSGLPPWCMAGAMGMPTNKVPLKIKIY